jgi:hypothetical protein
MLRLLGFATLVLVALCLVLGASIALADEDMYEFDFTTDAGAKPNMEFDAPADLLEIR